MWKYILMSSSLRTATKTQRGRWEFAGIGGAKKSASAAPKTPPAASAAFKTGVSSPQTPEIETEPFFVFLVFRHMMPKSSFVESLR